MKAAPPPFAGWPAAKGRRTRQSGARSSTPGAVEFTGRYPQLLLGEQFWLPFERNTIIEEPDWHGKTERFGSNTRLAEEIRELKAMIEEADPHVTQWTWEAGRPEDILGAAWQAGETMVRICTAAIARHLPFWTAG